VKRRILGTSGISVSEITLGAMMFGSMGNSDHQTSVGIIRTALDAGINFIDTADVYSAGESEVIVGKAIQGRRDDVVIATKFGLPMGQDPNHSGGSARWIRLAVEGSLRRMETEWIDLYQMHRPDYDTSIDETLSTLSDLVREGKVRAIGSSTFAPDLIVEAQWAAHRGGGSRFVSEQPLYSILTRSIERAVLPTALRHGMGVLSYSPLNAGWLSGRTDPSSSHRAASRPTMYDPSVPANQKKAEAVLLLDDVAKEAGIPLPHLALAFVLSHRALTSVIIGPRTLDQLTSLLPAAEATLEPSILDRIDEIVAPGTDINADDNYQSIPADLVDPSLRRR
jgi:aryl-alcohol dehydrogenase-like predicted oxidoreductase